MDDPYYRFRKAWRDLFWAIANVLYLTDICRFFTKVIKMTKKNNKFYKRWGKIKNV